MKVKILLQSVKQGNSKDTHGLFHVSYNFRVSIIQCYD